MIHRLAAHLADLLVGPLPADPVVDIVRFAGGGVDGVALRGVQVHAEENRALGGEGQGDGLAEAGGGAGYQGHAIEEAFGHFEG